ncbi:MAG: type I-E CRISPR-associated endoribonuclease Cas2, partial [Verrucomicrobia bacterium]
MTVIICNNTPDCIRGHLKRWFIEPKPNVFVGTVNVKTRE